MKLVERLVTRKQYYDNYSLKDELTSVVASNVLFETEDLLAIGSFLNEELRLDFDCNRLLKLRGALEDKDTCMVYEKRLSEYYHLSNEEDTNYYLEKEILIEK